MKKKNKMFVKILIFLYVIKVTKGNVLGKDIQKPNIVIIMADDMVIIFVEYKMSLELY